MFPVYDLSVLPCPERTTSHTHEVPMAGLGYRAFTGKQYIEIHVKTMSQAEALYNFWLNDCKYGLNPFMLAVNYMGSVPERDDNNALVPNYMVRFKGSFIQSVEKLWKSNIKLELVGKLENNMITMIQKEIVEYAVQIPYDVLLAPSTPTTFTASDNEVGQITMAWTDSTTGVDPITYDLYEDDMRVAIDISSPYIYVAGKRIADYHIVAKNEYGETISDVDEGMSCEEITSIDITDEQGRYVHIHVVGSASSPCEYAKYRVKIGGIEQTPTACHVWGAVQLILSTPAYRGQTVTLSLLERSGFFVPYSDVVVTNDSTEVNPAPPQYNFTEELIEGGA